MKTEIRYIEKIRPDYHELEENSELSYAYSAKQMDMIKLLVCLDGKNINLYAYADGDRLSECPIINSLSDIKKIITCHDDAVAKSVLQIIFDLGGDFIKNSANRTMILGDFFITSDLVKLCKDNDLQYIPANKDQNHVIQMNINDKSIPWGEFDTLLLAKKAVEKYIEERAKKTVD